MAQFQELIRVLLSAGVAMDPEDKGAYFLYTDSGNLTSKFFTGNRWTNQDIIAMNARKRSPASYLLSPSTCLIVYVTSSSSLSVLQYDDEDEEWVELEGMPSPLLHADGRLAASFLPSSKENFYIFFQDPSNHLVCLDREWKQTILPADPLVGTPISPTNINDQLHVFYVSNEDHYLHYLLEESDNWVDRTLAKCMLDVKLKSFTVGQNDKGILEAYVLTDEREAQLLQITGEGEGEARMMGRVNEGGSFLPGTDAECALFICAPIVFGVMKLVKSLKNQGQEMMRKGR